MNEPRRHHYVTEAFLAGFTEMGTRDDMVWVHDLSAKKCRRQRPHEVAHQRDFNRVQIEGEGPMLVEDAYAELEGRALPAIRQIDSAEELPGPEGMKAVLGFVAHLAVRVPHHRRWLAQSMSKFAKLELEMSAGTPELFAQRLAALESTGAPVEGLTYERVREVIDSESFSLEPDHTWLVAHSVVDGERLYQLLLQRRWALLIAARGLSRFVASDNPVTFVPLEEQVAVNGWGWATPSTAAAIPLTKRCALIGTFERPPVDARVVSSPREIAHVNGWTVRTASRFVFSAGKDFIWTRPDGRMGNAADVFGSR